MAETEIVRKPGDCDFDLDEVCKEVTRQNELGNLLKSHKIEQDKITLTFE